MIGASAGVVRVQIMGSCRSSFHRSLRSFVSRKPHPPRTLTLTLPRVWSGRQVRSPALSFNTCSMITCSLTHAHARETTGEGLEFSVVGGECDSATTVKIPRATAEETEDASYSYCTLPAPASSSDYRTDTCTALSSGMKIEGVGLFYDDRCNSADLSGCGARSIPACRLCFVDKERWRMTFPSERVPDWEECPCCVANQLGVACATGDTSGGTDEGVIIGVSVGIAGVIAIACCLSCAFGTTIVRFVSTTSTEKMCRFDCTNRCTIPDADPCNIDIRCTHSCSTHGCNLPVSVDEYGTNLLVQKVVRSCIVVAFCGMRRKPLLVLGACLLCTRTPVVWSVSALLASLVRTAVSLVSCIRHRTPTFCLFASVARRGVT